ncbi:MAG: hypothetical protein DMG30_19740 [Acidobacteria bacterium]|nr:MAG: hypothetical protein DMG30_19740 [Acidobacteriota bacterium]
MLAIVKPETVVACQLGFRLFWTWKVQRGRPGRRVVSREARARQPSHFCGNYVYGASAGLRR